MKSRPWFDDIVNKDGFDDQYGHIPVQPADESSVGGVNSFAVSPMFEGVVQPEVAQQCGCRMPSSPYRERGTTSGARGSP